MRLIDRLTGQQQTTPGRATTEFALMETWRNAPGKDAPAFDFVSIVQDAYLSNGVVFAVTLARMSLFSEAEMKFRRRSDKSLFGTPALSRLETPWVGGSTGELLARMEQHASFGGCALVVRSGDGVKLLRPDWTQRVSAVDMDGERQLLGYLYNPTGWVPGSAQGQWEEPRYYAADEVASYIPNPDPLDKWRGVSWLTSVVAEINGDLAMNTHKQRFFDNAATPNLVVRYQKKLPDGYVKAFAEQFDARHSGAGQSWRTVILDEAADLTVVGNSFEQMTFTNLQAAGETRIAAAAGVPPIIAGLREGLQAATYANYSAAMRRFVDMTIRPNWREVVKALEVLIDVPAGAQLWFDTTDIAALQEGEKERADAAQVNATTLNTLITAGFTPESATSAVIAGDFSLLQHSGLVSVQLQAPGSQAPPASPDLPA